MLKKLIAASSVLLMLAGCSGFQKADSFNTQVFRSDSAAMTAEADSGSGYSEVSEDISPEEAGEGDSGWISEQNSDSVLVYTANVTMETKDYQKTWEQIKDKISDFGGFMVSENLSNRSLMENPDLLDSDDGDEIYSGFYTLKIPADKLDDFLQKIDSDGNIVSLSKNAENITRRYNETKDEIDFLNKQQKRLSELLDQAKDVSEIIAIEEKQMEVEQQLKNYNNQLNDMNMDVDYSTVYLSIEKVSMLSAKNPGFGSQVLSALRNTWIVMIQGLGDILIFIIYLLPWLLVLALIVWLIRRVLKKRNPSWKRTLKFRKNSNSENHAEDKKSEQNIQSSDAGNKTDS